MDQQTSHRSTSERIKMREMKLKETDYFLRHSTTLLSGKTGSNLQDRLYLARPWVTLGFLWVPPGSPPMRSPGWMILASPLGHPWVSLGPGALGRTPRINCPWVTLGLPQGYPWVAPGSPQFSPGSSPGHPWV